MDARVALCAEVALDGLGHTYPGPVPAVADVSLTVPAGSFVALVGPSGCGKSTILRAVAGLLAPSAGSVRLAGRDCRGRPGMAAYMPQGAVLLPWRRVRDNAILGAEIAGMARREALDRAAALFDFFGLAGFEDAWPAQLSGGMRQRLALLRTFLTPRPVLLLDEPLGALDALTRRRMQEWLQAVWGRDGRTVVLVTHDVEEALVLADRVVVMTPRPGRVADIIDVPLPRPRGALATTTPAFAGLKARLLRTLDFAAAPDVSAVAQKNSMLAGSGTA